MTATLINVAKHNGSLIAVSKRLSAEPFYGWLFWFTRTIYNTATTNIAKHNGALSGIAKH
jgi:hypothetical protein